MTYITNKDFLIEVAAGRVAGFSGKTINGSSVSVGTSLMSIWNAANEIIDLGLQTTAATVDIASTNINDIAVTGSGARTVLVTGLDASGVDQTEIISLNGQTEVTTTNTWSAIHELEVLTTGVDGANQGAIWAGNGVFTSGVPATKYLLMDADVNLSHTFVYTIPANKLARITSINLSSSDLDKGFSVRVCIAKPNNPTLYTSVSGVTGGSFVSLPRFRKPVSTGTTLTLQVIANQGTGGNFSAVTELLLEDVS